MKVSLVFGARPNFMKIAPIYRAMLDVDVLEPSFVHTGQHYDPEMSDDLREILELPPPHLNLGVGPGPPSWQMGEIVKRLGRVFSDDPADLVVVVGDVNSTLAAALAASTHSVPLAHVEAGLRSRDWTMPEERNRVLTDRLSNYLFTPTEDAGANLLAEGISQERIFLVGNVMIDSLDWMLDRLRERRSLTEISAPEAPHVLVTLHRPSNVDDPATLSGIVDALTELSLEVPVKFPIHPRTRARMAEFGIVAGAQGVECLPPLGYAEFLMLLSSSRLVLTDSGGIQEEAMVLGVPCLTLRDTTERPVTLTADNELVGNDPSHLLERARDKLGGIPHAPARPHLWDGAAATRIVDVLEEVWPPPPLAHGGSWTPARSVPK